MDVSGLHTIAGGLLLVIILSLYRIVFGPSPHDRLVGLNLMVSEITALMAVMAVIFQRHVYLDVALIYIILGFISILAIAKYLKGKAMHE